MRLRKRSLVLIIIISILVISAGSFFWIMNSPKFVLKATNVELYPIQKLEQDGLNDEGLARQQRLNKEFDKLMAEAVAKQKKEGKHGYISMLSIASQIPGFGVFFDSDYNHTLVTIGKYLSGTLINNSFREFSDINIEFAIYNAAGNQIGTFNIHIDNLQPHKTCKFNKDLDKQLFDNGVSSCEVVRITAKR